MFFESPLLCASGFQEVGPGNPKVHPGSSIHSTTVSYFSFSRNFSGERTLDYLSGVGFHPVLSWTTCDRPRMSVCHVVADSTVKLVALDPQKTSFTAIGDNLP